MSRVLTFSTGEFYHVYNRGTDKRAIFLDDTDRIRFMKLLYLCNSKKGFVFRDIPSSTTYEHKKGENIVDIGAYCLMDNHFHLLLHEKTENGISAFMLKLLTAYSSYFNKKYSRTGSLFEGTFRAEHADDDNYLKYLFSYIHLNPVKIINPSWKEIGVKDTDSTKNYLKNYKFSSYLEYAGSLQRRERSILNKNAFPEYFTQVSDFEQCLMDWLTYNT